MGVSVTGGDEIRRNLRNIQNVTPEAAGAALFTEAEFIMTDIKTQWVPVDVGTLKDSGRVLQPEITADLASVTLGFGGAASAYALIQHEGFFNHPGQGRRKYLEEPLRIAAPRLGAKLAIKIGNVWRRVT